MPFVARSVLSVSVLVLVVVILSTSMTATATGTTKAATTKGATTAFVSSRMMPVSTSLTSLTTMKPSTQFREKRAASVFFPSLRATVDDSTETASTDGTIQLHSRLSQIQPSKTVEIFSLVKQMQAEGTDVTSLCVGEPDFCPPQPVLDALVKAVQSGDTKYTAVTGTLELRKAILHDMVSRRGVPADAYSETDIVVGNGAKQSVYQAILATCGEGDEVLVPVPYWPSYPEMVKLAGATPVLVDTNSQDGYLLTPTVLRKTLEDHPNAKLLIFCNPSNPTGAVHDQQHLQSLVNVLQDFPHLTVLADEIYERLVYDGSAHCPAMATLMPQRTITINGFSKAYAMTGLRLGYAVAPSHVAKAMATIQGQLTSCASSISQAAGVAALQDIDEAVLIQLYDEMKGKRDYVLSRLEQMPHVKMDVPPQGAFYVLPDVSYYSGEDDTQLCLDILQQAELALVPGSSFGKPGTVRISYATSLEELDVAMTKLEKFLESKR